MPHSPLQDMEGHWGHRLSLEGRYARALLGCRPSLSLHSASDSCSSSDQEWLQRVLQNLRYFLEGLHNPSSVSFPDQEDCENTLHAMKPWIQFLAPHCGKIQDQEALLTLLMTHGDYVPEVQRLLSDLLKRRRLSLLPKIVERYEECVDCLLKRYQARIVSAFPLSASEKKQMESWLSLSTGESSPSPGQWTIVYEHHPDLLGGMVLYFGDRVVDASLLEGLKQCKDQMEASF